MVQEEQGTKANTQCKQESKSLRAVAARRDPGGEQYTTVWGNETKCRQRSKFNDIVPVKCANEPLV